jgi:hypothetical protein
VALQPISTDAYTGPYLQHQLVRIYLLVGEPEKALDRLEPLLKVPYYLSPGWLRIDPTFDPIRKHPRFLRSVDGPPVTLNAAKGPTARPTFTSSVGGRTLRPGGFGAYG